MFRFTIRDVLLLMVIVGLGVGWWIDHRRLDVARAVSEARSKSLEARELQWQRLNRWLTAALEGEGTGFVSVEEAAVLPAGDSR